MTNHDTVHDSLLAGWRSRRRTHILRRMRIAPWAFFLTFLSLTQAALAADLAAPVFAEPLGDALRSVSPHPHVAWNAVPEAERYRVQIFRAEAPAPIIEDTVHAVLRWFVVAAALEPGDYSARVRAERDDDSAGPWSEMLSLAVVEPAFTFEITPLTPFEEVRRISLAAAASPSARIRLAAGEYKWTPGYQQAVFAWKGAKNIILEGKDAHVVLDDPSSQLIALDGCSTIAIRDVKTSHAPLPYSALEVVAVDPEGEWFEGRVLAGFAEERYPREVNQFFVYAVAPDDFMRKHPDRPGHTYLAWGKTERVGDGVFRFFTREKAERGAMRQLQSGDRALACYRRWPLNLMSRCRDIAWSGLVGGITEGAPFMGGDNTDIKFLGLVCKSHPPYFPAAGGWVTGNDRRGPWIQNCIWEGLTDDGPNITGNLFLIDAVHGDREFVVSTGPAYQTATWRAGDDVLFWDPTTGEPLAETTIASVSREAHRITFSTKEPVSGIVPGRDFPSHTHVYNLSTQNQQLLIRGNLIRGGRRFGFNVKAIDALIDRNRFEAVASCAIYLENEPTGWEGIVNRNVVVQGNVLIGCGTDAASRRWQRAGIHVNTWRPGRGMDETEWMGNRNILVRRNVFEGHAGVGIGIDNADGVIIHGNTFSNPSSLADGAIRVFGRVRNVVRDDGQTSR